MMMKKQQPSVKITSDTPHPPLARQAPRRRRRSRNGSSLALVVRMVFFRIAAYANQGRACQT